MKKEMDRIKKEIDRIVKDKDTIVSLEDKPNVYLKKSKVKKCVWEDHSIAQDGSDMRPYERIDKLAYLSDTVSRRPMFGRNRR